MYAKTPDSAQLSSFGLRPEDFEEPSIDVWPDNWQAVRIFLRCDNQWRHGPRGPTGLDYTLALALIERQKPTDAEFEDLMDALGILESAAIETIY